MPPATGAHEASLAHQAGDTLTPVLLPACPQLGLRQTRPDFDVLVAAGDICEGGSDTALRVVPGLTAEALSAIDRLKQAGAGTVRTMREATVDQLMPYEIGDAACVGGDPGRSGAV